MELDWETLEELRASYLDGSAGAVDYWTSDSLLRGYDATFARRIAWKWQWVLRELDRLQWSPPSGTVVDYGCGTGVAAREVLAHYRGNGLDSVALHDRSPRALRFAAEAVRREFPDVTVTTQLPESAGLMLVSHVLPELDEAGIGLLLATVEKAQAVIIVEPGTRDASRRLIALREKLVSQMQPVAPCVHAAQCGLLTPENERHWCHFFVTPPNIVFTDPGWVQFGKVMGIDLRSLPLSFLVMDRRAPAPLPSGSVRVLGKPRMYKAYALLQGCDASGVAEKRLTIRTDTAFFKATAKHRTPTLQRWETEGGEITKVESVRPGGPPEISRG
jgi:SAM-dependent methyltransferase